jgi:hypothetical protein
MRNTLATMSILHLLACSSAARPEHESHGSGGGATSATTSATTSGGGGSAFTSCAGSSEAHEVFNELWSDFDARYAVFDIRLPNETWAAVGEKGCAKLDDAIAGPALFDALLDMARHLDDGHVTLEAPELGLDEDAWVSEYSYYDQLYELEFNAEERYLDGPLTWAANDWIAWGTIGDVGYVSITSMEEYGESGDEEDDMAVASAVMAQLMSDLASAGSLVVDVRANEGGWDGVSLEIAKWFGGAETVAWSEQRRNGPAHDDFGAWEDFFVEAAPAGAFGGDVVVLTSGGSFSAAETFLLAIRVRDRVTLLGEPSSGHFSDQMEAVLPNGWIYQFSFERYRAADGEIYEARGVPVDVPVAFDVTAFASGQDVMLEQALAMLAQN